MSSSKICMNGLCGAKTTHQWKRGWAMKAGGFATLCYSCGTVYEHVNYCERFHLNEPGWRECKFCEKPIHCGCVVSKYLHECLDLGGISCIKCIRARGTQALKPMQSHPNDLPNGFTSFSATWHPVIGNRMNSGSTVDKGKLTQLTETIEKQQPTPSTSSLGHQFKQEENRLSSSELNIGISSNKDVGTTMFPNSSSFFDNARGADLGFKSLYESMPQPSLSYSLGNHLATTKSSVNPTSTGPMEPEKVPSFKQGQRSRLLFVKPSKSAVTTRPQSNKGMVSDNRVARPPAEGRGRNQLLPRYWPKMTDQELLQISGDLNSNCTITPLFEKVLSASDAGRIGRLVLPKACAEAYFPAINQSEEGVTPCIQNMQLQAGDTVIFSRLDPGEKLVIGCRKATVSSETQVIFLQHYSLCTTYQSLISFWSLFVCSTLIFSSLKTVENEAMANGDQKTLTQEKKRSRNIGLKNKRLLMHNEDAMELKVTWEEAHELLRPSPNCNPTISMIEDCEFEEYDEPPVFGKKTVFTVNASGSQEQWAQCDNCSKWRRLPPDVLLPPKWTCSDNVWDPDRCSCSAPDEISTKNLERIFKYRKDFKMRKLGEGKMVEEQEPSGLDALATAAVLGETIGEFGESSTGPTTRHPRHRPGCSCIVCIQPPSGKGKHKPNCFCNVCLTVKRRFKTLMLRKKKRLSDQEAELAQKSLSALGNGSASAPAPAGGRTGIEMFDKNAVEVEVKVEAGESSGKGGQQLDLNCDPDKEEEITTMVDANASGIIPLEWKNVIAGLVPCSLPKGTSEIIEGHPTTTPVVRQPSPPSPGPPGPPAHPTATDGTVIPVDDRVVEALEKVEDKAVEDGRC
ncbi:hypothetical protein SSX86_015389 [Deinandra increscens subsp. villosa]|uniref:CW-type domain-containing protein n=1 Tax=Deinandra increscens subsp. villosa TaxID=3103831 RepID=A0AAP0D520_9ASTR